MANRNGFILLGLIAAAIAVADMAVLFDIPVLRQISGIVLLTVLPGMLIMFLLNLDKLEITEKIVLTIGLSIAFLMFFGLALNQTGLFFGNDSPLSTGSLVLWLNLVLIALLIAAYLRNRDAFTSNPFGFKLDTRGKLCLLLPVTLPLLSVLGMRLLNTSDSNIVLLALLFLIPVAIIVITLLRRGVSEDTYPLAIFMMAAAIALMFWLRSEHIWGADIHYEYYLSRITLLNQYWSIIDFGPVDACLSVTMLPVIYQSLLQVQGEEYLFLGIFALIWVFTPLVVYVIARKYVGQLYAFMAAFLWISQTMFLFGDARIRPALFFFALAIMVLFHDRIRGARQTVLLVVFMAAVIISHYSTTYIFFFMLLFTWLLGLVFSRYILPKNINVIHIGVFFGIIFLWYSQLTGAAFKAGVSFFSSTLAKLLTLGVTEAKEGNVALLLGNGVAEKSILVQMQWGITWVTFALIAIGVLGILVRHKEMLSAPLRKDSVSAWLPSRLETEFFLIALVSCGILVASIAAPRVSHVYGLGKLYGQTLVILVPLFIIGCVMLAKYCRINPSLLILPVLIVYFLFASSAVHEVFGIHRATVLSSQSPTCDYDLVHEQETRAARWARENIEQGSLIYCDLPGSHRLATQGGVSTEMRRPYWLKQQEINGYIYLNYNNVVNGKWLASGGFHDLGEYPNLLGDKNKLYGSNGSEIWE